MSSDNLPYACIKKAMENENYKKYVISVTGTSDKSSGYLGDIIFAKVTGTTNSNEEKVLNLVIKHSKNNPHLRESTPIMKCVFLMEAYIYSKVFPAFKKLEAEKNILDGFSAVPKCYGTFILENMDVIILENQKQLGYELHDRMKSLNIQHLKMILKEYGKFHALSFALRDQKNEEFKVLTAGLKHSAPEAYIKNDDLLNSFETKMRKARQALNDEKDLNLFDRWRNILEDNCGIKIRELVEETKNYPEECVITHGDCWNNNFMYKYKDSDKITPSNVVILDWQLITIASPIFDISYLLYTQSSKDELDQFNILISEYYASFSTFLRQLGSDPEKLFPFSKLKNHWKKYSLYGLIIAVNMLPVALCNEAKAPDLENMKDNETVMDVLDFDIEEKTLFRDRFIAALSHYFECTF